MFYNVINFFVELVHNMKKNKKASEDEIDGFDLNW
jgi:hypothetical protein